MLAVALYGYEDGYLVMTPSKVKLVDLPFVAGHPRVVGHIV
jgi:hypothetical protein